MKHVTQTEFIITLSDLIIWMNESFNKTGFRAIDESDIEKLFLDYDDESKKVDNLHIVLKKNKPLLV